MFRWPGLLRLRDRRHFHFSAFFSKSHDLFTFLSCLAKSEKLFSAFQILRSSRWGILSNRCRQLGVVRAQARVKSCE
jgi:hypothetical protein